MKYKTIKNNVWQTPIAKGYKLICCQCGLIHSADFRVHKGDVQFRLRRLRGKE
jgi:hypothetical protein